MHNWETIGQGCQTDIQIQAGRQTDRQTDLDGGRIEAEREERLP